MFRWKKKETEEEEGEEGEEVLQYIYLSVSNIVKVRSNEVNHYT